MKVIKLCVRADDGFTVPVRFKLETDDDKVVLYIFEAESLIEEINAAIEKADMSYDDD